MKRRFCVFGLAALVAPVAGAADDITCERFPDADAVLVDDVSRIAYNPDGTYVETSESWTKVLTEKGRREESTVTLHYSKRYGTASVDFVGIVGTNGAERAVDVSATTRESTDNGSMAANIYDPLDRRIVCTVPGLGVGETLHVKTTRRALKPRCAGQWSDLAVFAWSNPILRSRVEIRAPAARPLRRIAIRHPRGNVVTSETPLADGGTLHVFTATNSAQAFPEPDMPPLYTQVQHLRVSTAADWPEISRWYWDLCAPHLAKTNAAMIAKIEDLKSQISDFRSQISDSQTPDSLTPGARTSDSRASDSRASSSLTPGARNSDSQVSSSLTPEARNSDSRIPDSEIAPSQILNLKYQIADFDTQLLRAIFKFVSQEVRYMGLTMEDTSPGYAPHDVDVTFDNRYGVCRDKAGLLVAMLRLAGFKAFPVLINVGAKLDPDVPQPFFNHAIVAVELPKGDNAISSSSSIPLPPSPSSLFPLSSSFPYVLMDPTNENAKDLFPAYESDKSYLVCRPEGDVLRLSPTPTPDHNALVATSKGTLAKDGSLVLESDVRFGGVNDTVYRPALVKMTGEDRVKFFERVVKRLAAGTELIRCEIEPADMRDTETPIRVKLAARLPEMLLAGETCDRLDVPFVTKTLGMANFLLAGNTSLERRTFPLVLDSTACVDERLEIDLAGVVGAAKDLPPDVRIDGGYSYRRAFAVSNGVLRAHRRLAVAQVEFSASGYANLREDVKRVEAAERRQPVFAVDPLAEADVRRIDESTEVDIASDTAWTVTNRVVKEILTYKGKKGAAELKFRFNPCVETFDLVSATVSNRDGRVYAVSPREKNVMDCGWAASAPRYPASRILVVNLPSVEIGSTVSYTTVRAVTNAPAAYYGAFGFDSHEPLDRRFVRVNGWTREVRRPRRIPDEPGQPAAALWRDRVVVSSNRFARLDLKVAPLRSDVLPDGATVREIRDWMARHVKLAGPGLYEVPLGLQLTDPAVVLKERYATRLDYVRTLCALLRGAGHEADVVLAADNANEPDILRNRDKHEKPNVRAFDTALCRVRVREGGFLGFGGETKTCYLGTENEHSPLGPTAYAGSDAFDPATGAFEIVTVPDADFRDRTGETSEYLVREDGAVDLTVVSSIWGSGVGGFRKRYAEILPEDRSRLYQAILGGVAQAASATRELEADVEGYPATQRFSCYVPDFATVAGDTNTITLQLPALVSSIPTFTGRARQTPFAVGAADAESEEVTVRFPVGYTQAEHLPEPFAFAAPGDPSRTWLVSSVTSRVEGGALVVTIRREVMPRISSWYAPDVIELVRERSRRAASRANRTLVVRRP